MKQFQIGDRVTVAIEAWRGAAELRVVGRRGTVTGFDEFAHSYVIAYDNGRQALAYASEMKGVA